MKILKHFILFMLFVLLVGVVSAEEIDDAGTYDISESVKDSTVPSTDTLTAQTDESTSNNVEKTNTGNVKSEEEYTLNSWNKLVDKVNSLRNTTEDVTITLDEGTFTNTGTIYWESDNPIVLTIDGNGQSIDGNGQHVFNISVGSSLVLKNLIIENASSRYGGAIYNDGLLIIINSTFVNNIGVKGGVIWSQGPLTVNNSNFINNYGENGGSIFIVRNVDNNTIVNSYFKNNTAHYGGAVDVYDDFQRNEGYLFIDSNIFTDNSAIIGGALYLDRSSFITNNQFTNNRVTGDFLQTVGAAIYLQSFAEECTVNLINNTFGDNVVEKSIYGGAVYARGSLFLNSYKDTFINNVVESGFGGAICAQQGALLNISHGTFKNNRATWAGAIYCESMLDVTDSEFIENNAEYGGAIASLNAKITVKNSKFKDLYANRSGGAIGIFDNDLIDTSISGMISVGEGLNLSEIIIENCEFSNVSSRHNGGAICFSDLQDKYPDCIFVTMRVNNSTFTNCKSEFGGAILKLNGNLTINNSEFDGINAYESGGAIYTSQANLDIMNSSFTDYTANTDGELIYFEKGLLTISDSVFYDNKSESGKTSSIYLYDSSTFLTDSYFENPESSVYGVFVEDYNIENTTLNEDKISLNNTDYITMTTYQGKKLELINQTHIDEIPTSYDLRDYGLVTPVKDQQRMGACIAFANIAAIESALLKQTNTEYDLSENNMYSNILKYFKYGSKNAYEGLYLSEAIVFTLNWIGIIPEEYDEYDSLGTITKIIDTDEKIRVQDVMIIYPDTQDWDKLIKEAILNYGAVAVNINGTFDNYNWNPETNSLYNPDSCYINHAVAVVGWDDNYSKENFLVTPPGDGAWILKNSYGSDKYDEGYFYMSYYDKSFIENGDNDPEFTIVYIFNNTINYKTNYQTDLTGFLHFNSNYTYYSNTYTAYYNESLAAVGTYFNESGVDYEFKIYVNGKQVLTQNGTSNYAGYKTIILDKYIPIMEGDTFKVVFKNNILPYQSSSRQHYLKNISFISKDGENWEDITENNQTVCLKVYTVETEDNDTNDTNNTNNTPSPQPKPVKPKAKHVQTHKTTHNNIRQTKTHVIRLANDNTIVYAGSALTLEALNRIFDMNFTNGQLLVYIDGVLVFNQTTTDDISQVILELLDKYLGEHEIKVVFTGGDNHTDTFKENIVLV